MPSSARLRAALLLASGVPLALHAECASTSRTPRAHLVELYTSEGCSSCPPADRYLGTLLDRPGFVALEFHVDYWDSSAWRDPYADVRFGTRQKRMAGRARGVQVVTPQFAVDGQAWVGWPRSTPPEPAQSRAPALSVTARTEGPLLQVGWTIADTIEGDHVFAALATDGLSNAVRGGENRGRTLAHDRVVRAFSGPLEPSARPVPLSMPADAPLERSSLVVFVEDRAGDVVQAVSMPLAGCAR